MKLLGRLKSKFGGNLEEFECKTTIDLTPRKWEFISKITGLPKKIIDRYSMLYNTGNNKGEVNLLGIVGLVYLGILLVILLTIF